MLGFIVGVRLKERVRVGVRVKNESDAFDLRNICEYTVEVHNEAS